MKGDTKTLRYLIITRPSGVTLSKFGNWGNLPYPDAAAAEAAARADAGNSPLTIERTALRR